MVSKNLRQNNNSNNQQWVAKMLCEALEYKDMDGMMKPSIHIDEFASKMGDDDEIIVASFYVRSLQAAKDLVNWFERGYEWVLDSETSPGEIKPSRFLVYIEIKRRTSAGDKLNELLSDLGTLTEFTKPNNWSMTYEGKEYPWSVDTFNQLVPLSPKDYRQAKEQDLNEMRVASGLEPKQIFLGRKAKDIRQLQAAAGM